MNMMPIKNGIYVHLNLSLLVTKAYICFHHHFYK